MSQDLDAILNSISSAASTCYDLNGNGNLTNEEQTIFYQFAENIVFLLTQIHARYDAIAAGLADDANAKNELDEIWRDANTALEDFSKSITSPKLREAASKTAFAIDRTSSIIDLIPG